MVATRWERGRREGRTKNDENVDDVGNKTSSPELEVSKVSGRGRREETTNDDVDDDDVENKTNNTEMEVSKVRMKIWANENDKNDIDDINDDVSVVDHKSMSIRGRGMATMTVNRADHGLMR